MAVSVAWLAHAAQQASLKKVADRTSMSQSTANGPVIPQASKGDQCVADTALMRTDHMDLLNHQRDETVIQGIRNNPFSLVDCVDCHAQTTDEGTPIRIDAEGQFCQSCHAYAAVKIDCFTCHAALPEQPEEQSASWASEPIHSTYANHSESVKPRVFGPVISSQLHADRSDRSANRK